MSRGVSPNSSINQFSKSCSSFKTTFCDQDAISQLKYQVFEKDQNKKNYQKLLNLYHELQDKIKNISEQKKNFEFAIKQIETNEKSKAIIDLKNKNDFLFNELNEKIALNKKLYNENNNLFHELESKAAHNQNLQDKVQEQQLFANRLNHDKDQLRSRILSLGQIKEKQENDIQNLNIQINQISFDNNSQENCLKTKNGQNFELMNTLNDEKNINKSLIVELRNRESNLISSQQKLTRDNDTIKLMQNDITNLTNIIKKNADDFSVTQNNLINETSVLNQVSADNQHFQSLIKDRDDHINQITNENNIIKRDNTELNCYNDKSNRLLISYKKHLNLLLAQNKKLSIEIQTLIGRDTELRKILERDDHLSDIRFENEQVVRNSNEKLSQIIDDPIMDSNMTTSISRNYSMNNTDNRNYRKHPISSRNYMITNTDKYNRIRSLDNMEMNSSFNEIINKGNDFKIMPDDL